MRCAAAFAALAAAGAARASPRGRIAEPYRRKQYGGADGMAHSGTPGGVPASADCAVRRLGYEYGKKLAPQRGDFRTLFDALQLGACGDAVPPQTDAWAPPPTRPLQKGEGVLHVDPNAPPHPAADGSAAAPFRSVESAVARSRVLPKPLSIVLHAGTHFVKDTIKLGSADSGLTVTNAAGDRAELSGGVKINPQWRPSKACQGCFEADLSGAGIQTVPGLRRNGVREIRARFPNFDPEIGSVIDGEAHYHDGVDGWVTDQTAWISDGVDMNGVSGQWPPKEPATTYVMTAADWPSVEWPMSIKVDGKDVQDDWTGEGDWGEYWVGVNGTCVDRSPPVGYWCAPGAPRKISTPNHPGGITVAGQGNSPYKKPKGAVVHAWRPGHWYTNMFEVRGYDQGSPKWVFHANENNIFGRCAEPTVCESGVKHVGSFQSAADCQKAANATGAAITSVTWHHTDFGGEFSSHCYVVTDGKWGPTAQDKVDSIRAPHAGGNYLEFARGGFQGGEGVTGGENWYIENVMEELDMEREWFFDEDTKMLYYKPNATAPGAVRTDGTPTGEFIVASKKELIRVEGTKSNPAHHVAIRGITLRDTAYTYMDPHGLPSGGDWALQKTGAITLIGCENIEVSGNLFTRLDGNALFIGGYQRGLNVTANEFSFIGDSVMAAWGDTSENLNENGTIRLPWKVGPDGRSGEQPRGSVVSNNIVHEIGLWQKQSSMWFQAVTAQTQLHGNIFFNGPRAALNFNDGFGGGDDISGNLLINTCRESSDHGPWNSWDRVPYITDLRTGKPSIIPADRHIHNNYVLATYNSQEAIDTDDGSAYYRIYNNFFAYADNGLKSDFGGHDESHYQNVYAYVSTCFSSWSFKGYNDGFWNNTCVFRGSYGSTCFKPGFGIGWRIGNNSVYSQSGDEDVCGTQLSKWLAAGNDKGTTIAEWPADDQLVAWGRALLGM